MEKIHIFVVVINLLQFGDASYVFEGNLHKVLLTGYNLDVRPEIGYERPVLVKFDFILETVHALDVKQQVLDVSAFVTLEWNDPQLKWNITRFGNIDEIIVSPSLIWTPDVVLYNSGEQKPPSVHSELYKTKVKVENNGDITWIAPTNWKVSCSCDIKWFPFDSQTCTMNFGSWSYNYKRLDLKKSAEMDNSKHVLGGYNGVSGGEWNVTSVSTANVNTTFRCCRNPFTTISIQFHLQRMPLYYLLYTLLPLIALIIMMALIFHLDIGQRASYGVTILLSISVFLLVLSDNLPEKSDDLPWVGISFIAEYIALCLAVPFAEYSAHISQRSHSPPPLFIMKVISYCRMKPHPAEKMEAEGDEDVEDQEESKEVSKELKHGHVKFSKETDNGVICYEKQWKVVGRFLDKVLSVVFIVLVIILPVIIGGVCIEDK